MNYEYIFYETKGAKTCVAKMVLSRETCSHSNAKVEESETEAR
jgi:hypothetical protein